MSLWDSNVNKDADFIRLFRISQEPLYKRKLQLLYGHQVMEHMKSSLGVSYMQILCHFMLETWTSEDLDL